MNIAACQQEILRLKKEKDVCILAHSYQPREVVEIADFTGDSYGLSLRAKDAPAGTLLLCGVRFMAETAKLLSPAKKVVLAAPAAGCPMAEQFTPEQVLAFKETHPDYAVVAYVNTTAALKTVCDVCVTSSCAVQVVAKLPQQKILFIPDCNLGAYVAACLPNKQIELWQGGCPVHAAITEEEAAAARAAHPGALLLVHPECRPAVSRMADYVGSTTGIVAYAKESPAAQFIIGTERAIPEQLAYECPGKRFYPLSKSLICPDMKLTTLPEILRCLREQAGEEITLPPAVATGAVRCLAAMMALGG